MKKKVSIIIVNYNTETLLDACIGSIYDKTSGIDYEIIVVDNDSDKNSLSAFVQKYPTIKVYFSDENLGFGRANNLGAKMAQGDYVFFLNPDTLLINNAIYSLFQYMDSHPRAGVCGGNMYKGDMTPASSLYDIDFLLDEYKIIFNRKRVPGFNRSNKPKEVRVIVGADFFIRKDLFLDSGGFDEDFFMYFEEVELCTRIRKKGYHIVSVFDAEIIHLQGGSAENKTEELSKWSYQEHWYSKFLFFYKTRGRLQTMAVRSAYMLKLRLAMVYFMLIKNDYKLAYWRQKRTIISNAYNRYKQYLKS